jgi:hypothetical protein
MTKTDIIKLFGNSMEVARFFGISAAAVSAWEEVPELRQYQLAERRPELYRKYIHGKKGAKKT